MYIIPDIKHQVRWILLIYDLQPKYRNQNFIVMSYILVYSYFASITWENSLLF